MKEITRAIVNVQEAIKGIEKNKSVGAGQFAYKAVSDQDVKKIVRVEMTKNGLTLLPISIKPTVRIDRWDEGGKAKQQIFTEVETKYKLMHTSGESIELAGYGHGVDTQDKSAGKASTYALKYLLLYMFLIPTGDLDDADNDPSDGTELPVTPSSRLIACKSLVELQNVYLSFTAEEKTATLALKDELKTKLK